METQVEWRGDQCPGPALNIDTRPAAHVLLNTAEIGV